MTTRIAPQLSALAVPIDAVRPHPRNPNQGDVGSITTSLEQFAQYAPIVVQRSTGHIVKGNHTYLAARALGWTEIAANVMDLDDTQALAVLVGDNRHSELGTRDQDALGELLTELAQADALLGTGYDGDDVDALLAELLDSTKGQTDPDAVPGVPDEPITKPGDLWVLGRHRLACIDATDVQAVERLFGDTRPQMVFADPPYGIDIVDVKGWVGGTAAYDIPFGGVKNRKGLGSANGAKPFGSKDVRGSVGASNVVEVGRYAPVIGDDSTDTAVAAYGLASSLFPAAVQVWWGGNYYANMLPPSSCWLVWDKENTGNFADAELAWTNQPSAVRLFRHMWNGMVKASEHNQKRVHPTQKPVALAEWVYQTCGNDGDVIFDPFLGSGMSLIAAEHMNRAVWGCELSPEYCDVIVNRWEAFTGGQAVRQ